ncbi:MAG: hypothetical protein HOV83_09625, partial [Catenulispora sp.]|nr:hypothetical protein [Catenulispora sp.]
GSVSETCEGAAPHAATGCPVQAWSVAEALRCWTAASNMRIASTVADVSNMPGLANTTAASARTASAASSAATADSTTYQAPQPTRTGE